MTPGVILRSWRATWSANVPLPRYHLLHGSQQRRWKRSSSANDGPTTARSDLQIRTQPSHRAATLHHPTTYTWVHPLGDIVSGLLQAGMALDWLHEHDGVPWRLFKVLTRSADRLWRWPDRPWLPLAFSLRATRRYS